MATKITDLPAETLVRTSDVVPLVDLSTTTTKKATVRTIMERCDGIIATLTGSKFSGPVTASAGLSASFITLGQNPGTTGHLRFTSDTTGYATLISHKYKGTGTTFDILQSRGDSAALQWGDPSFGSSFYGDGLTYVVGAAANHNFFLGAAVKFAITPTAATFDHPLTASLGISASFAQFNTTPASVGRVRFGGLGTQVQVAWSSDGGFNNHTLIGTATDGNGATFGGTTQPSNLYGSSVTVFGGSGDVFVYGGGAQSARFASDFAAITPVLSATFGLYVGGNNTLTLAHSGSTITAFNRYLGSRDDKGTVITTTGSPSKAILQYSGVVNGKTYAVDAIVTAQSVTTTGSAFYKLSGHYTVNSGGTLAAVVGSPYTILASANHPYLTASLAVHGSAGSMVIIVSGTQGVSAESFVWGCFTRVQEQGSV